MSKMDALRAMREERYEQAQRTATGAAAARGAQPARRTTAATRPPVAPPATDRSGAETADATGPETVEALCGHKNMGGRSCTRPSGHSEKSHRYS